jgi:hypothetical protein
VPGPLGQCGQRGPCLAGSPGDVDHGVELAVEPVVRVGLVSIPSDEPDAGRWFAGLAAGQAHHDVPDTGSLRDDALAMLRRTNDRMAAPFGAVLRGLLAGMQDDPDRLHEIREQLGRVGVGPWLTILARAVTRGEADPAALTPRVATVAVDLLRNEYGLNGMTTAEDGLLIEIVDEIYLPLVRPRG